MNQESEMRLKCSNCEKPFAHHVGGLVVHHEGTICTAICPACCLNVDVAKIVLKRDGDRFRYEQYLPAAVIKQSA